MFIQFNFPVVSFGIYIYFVRLVSSRIFTQCFWVYFSVRQFFHFLHIFCLYISAMRCFGICYFMAAVWLDTFWLEMFCYLLPHGHCLVYMLSGIRCYVNYCLMADVWFTYFPPWYALVIFFLVAVALFVIFLTGCIWFLAFWLMMIWFTNIFWLGCLIICCLMADVGLYIFSGIGCLCHA